MGNDLSKAVDKPESMQTDSAKAKSKTKHLSVKDQRTNVKLDDQPVIDTQHAGAGTHTYTSDQISQFKAMFSPHVPAGLIGRLKGWDFVFPFTSLMCDYTNGMWPYDGAFEREKLQMAEMNVNSSVGNPSWDFRYMNECIQVWLTVAQERCGVRVHDKSCEIGPDDLRKMIDLTSKCVTASHMPVLEAKLQTRALEMAKIKQRHVDSLENCAKAMMYGWAKRQAKIPTPRDLLNILAEVGITLPKQQNNEKAISVFPQLSNTKPACNAEIDEQPITN